MQERLDVGIGPPRRCWPGWQDLKLRLVYLGTLSLSDLATFSNHLELPLKMIEDRCHVHGVRVAGVLSFRDASEDFNGTRRTSCHSVHAILSASLKGVR
jgi:hypothetical protein